MSSESVTVKTALALTAGTQASKLAPNLKLWQQFKWPQCLQARIYKEWGDYYKRRLLHKKAVFYFDKTLETCNQKMHLSSNTGKSLKGIERPCSSMGNNICNQIYLALKDRSKCKGHLAQSAEAYADALEAQSRRVLDNTLDHSIVLTKCDAIYDNNRFEDSLVSLYMDERDFPCEAIKKHFELRRSRTLGVLEDTLGEGYSYFMLQNWPLILDLANRRKPSKAFMPRPLWQQLRENQHCDVESMTIKTPQSLPPLERARRNLLEKSYNFNYLGMGGTDIVFLRHLRNNMNFLSPLSRVSTPYLSAMSSEVYTIARLFMKMLHSRKPLYCRKLDRSNKNQRVENKYVKYLYRVEYQTRRDCFRMLQEVRELRRQRNIEKLTDYVEHSMSTNIVFKTHRTLPWKWQFVTEIYNILALAHVDRCAVPNNIDFLNLKSHATLYLLPTERAKDLTHKFGGINVYAEMDKDEERLQNLNVKIEKLEQRRVHSRYGIERTYLLFEMARSHLKHARFDLSMTMAQKAIDEAQKCKSTIWLFNSTFLVCQVHAAFNRFERLKEALDKAKKLAVKLKSVKLQAYLALCDVVNEYELEFHRIRHSELSLSRKQRKRKGRSSQESL